MKNQTSYSPEVREQAVRLVFEQQQDLESPNFFLIRRLVWLCSN